MARWLTNPLFLFLAVWLGATAFYLGGVFAGLFAYVEPRVLELVALNVVAFSLGYMTWRTFCRLRPAPARASILPSVPLTAERLRFSLKLTLAFGAVACLLCVARVVMVSSTYKIGLVRLISNPVLLRSKLTLFVGQAVYETRLSTIAISVTSSLFSIGFVLLGVLLYFSRDRRRYLYLLLFLLCMLGIGLLNLSRKEVMVNVLFLVLSYVVMHGAYRTRETADVARSLLSPFLALVLLFVLIDLLLDKSGTYDRGGRLEGFLFSLYWYIASPLAAFGEFLTDRQEAWSLGQSLFFPLHKWLHRLDLAGPSELAVFGEKVYIPYVANVYSYLRNVYEDFGVFGIAIVPYLLGWAAAVARRGAAAFLPCLNIYVILLALIVFSFYNYLLISNQFYLQAAFALIWFRFDLTNLTGARL